MFIVTMPWVLNVNACKAVAADKSECMCARLHVDVNLALVYLIAILRKYWFLLQAQSENFEIVVWCNGIEMIEVCRTLCRLAMIINLDCSFMYGPGRANDNYAHNNKKDSVLFFCHVCLHFYKAQIQNAWLFNTRVSSISSNSSVSNFRLTFCKSWKFKYDFKYTVSVKRKYTLKFFAFSALFYRWVLYT